MTTTYQFEREGRCATCKRPVAVVRRLPDGELLMAGHLRPGARGFCGTSYQPTGPAPIPSGARR